MYDVEGEVGGVCLGSDGLARAVELRAERLAAYSVVRHAGIDEDAVGLAVDPTLKPRRRLLGGTILPCVAARSFDRLERRLDLAQPHASALGVDLMDGLGEKAADVGG